jgi:SAM-dependent methyltransferase
MWDQRYSEEGFAYGSEPNDFLVAAVEFLPPNGTILCLGEGEGRNAVYLAERGHHVVAVDSSAVGLAKAASFARHRGVVLRTEKADLADYTIPPFSYDGIISIFCHLRPEVQAKVHAQIYQGLRPGGIFILEGFSKKQIEFDSGGPKDEALLMDLDTLKQELSALKLRHTVERERVIHEGKYHDGRSAIIQVIGVKE